MKRALLLCALLLSTPACDKAKQAVAGASGPLSADWTESYQMNVEGLDEAEASFHMVGSNRDGKDPLVMNAYFNGFPVGTEVTVGDEKKKVSDSGYLSLEIDMRPFLGKLAVDEASKEIDLGMDIEIHVPDRDPLKTKLPEQKVANDLAAAFARVRDRPVEFDGEPDASGKAKSLVAVEADTGFSDFTVMGPAEKVWDIDLVGVYEKSKSARTKACGGYKKIEGKVTIQMIDYKVALYDRRTGARTAEHRVLAKEECPMFITYDKETKKASRYADEKDVHRWLREQLKGVGKDEKKEAPGVEDEGAKTQNPALKDSKLRQEGEAALGI